MVKKNILSLSSLLVLVTGACAPVTNTVASPSSSPSASSAPIAVASVAPSASSVPIAVASVAPSAVPVAPQVAYVPVVNAAPASITPSNFSSATPTQFASAAPSATKTVSVAPPASTSNSRNLTGFVDDSVPQEVASPSPTTSATPEVVVVQPSADPASPSPVESSAPPATADTTPQPVDPAPATPDTPPSDPCAGADGCITG